MKVRLQGLGEVRQHSQKVKTGHPQWPHPVRLEGQPDEEAKQGQIDDEHADLKRVIRAEMRQNRGGREHRRHRPGRNGVSFGRGATLPRIKEGADKQGPIDRLAQHGPLGTRSLPSVKCRPPLVPGSPRQLPGDCLDRLGHLVPVAWVRRLRLHRRPIPSRASRR